MVIIVVLVVRGYVSSGFCNNCMDFKKWFLKMCVFCFGNIVVCNEEDLVWNIRLLLKFCIFFIYCYCLIFVMFLIDVGIFFSLYNYCRVLRLY